MPDIDEYINEIRPMWDTRWLTNMGHKHEQLRAELKDYLKVSAIELFVNGHLSLEMTMQVLTFPIYPDLELEVVDRICDMVRQGC